jgi:hypothetical protein
MERYRRWIAVYNEREKEQLFGGELRRELDRDGVRLSQWARQNDGGLGPLGRMLLTDMRGYLP